MADHRPTHDIARKGHSTLTATRQHEDKVKYPAFSLNEMIAKLERTLSTA